MFADILTGNARYAETFAHGDLGPVPARHVVALTCMDTRIDIPALLGLAIGDAHILRNAGGRVTDDVIRSLVVSIEVLETRAVAVIEHTECGMTTATDDDVRALVSERRGVDASGVEFLTIADQTATVQADVALLRASPLLPPDLAVAGFIYDIRSGRLTEVPTPQNP
ncbi:MAG TPA: carbonic anhydrase [Acidimicrobiia bacterium]|nr:carbonic anhydrase [Acidimicrobiia bacterium]